MAYVDFLFYDQTAFEAAYSGYGSFVYGSTSVSVNTIIYTYTTNIASPTLFMGASGIYMANHGNKPIEFSLYSSSD
jgi:hypothetical protein